jgi:hypothetical protein
VKVLVDLIDLKTRRCVIYTSRLLFELRLTQLWANINTTDILRFSLTIVHIKDTLLVNLNIFCVFYVFTRKENALKELVGVPDTRRYVHTCAIFDKPYYMAACRVVAPCRLV